mmetsp:Transcript_10807/g.17450  ORF Transcript_10807/g.17450 Transcript_10807/m.17450 type:complete len:283 (+) Transcript_10807:710-1558(+)
MTAQDNPRLRSWSTAEIMSLSNEKPARSKSREGNATGSCPANAFMSAWNEAEYFSKFDRSGSKSNDKNDENDIPRSNSTPRPHSEEEKPKAAKAYPRTRRRTEEHQPGEQPRFDKKRQSLRKKASAKPRSKSYRVDKPKNSKRLSQSSNDITEGVQLRRSKKYEPENTQMFSISCNDGIDGMFSDEYSFDFDSATPATTPSIDPPETERPCPNNSTSTPSTRTSTRTGSTPSASSSDRRSNSPRDTSNGRATEDERAGDERDLNSSRASILADLKAAEPWMS